MKIGDRIRLLKMDNDPDPIPVGSEGTITGITKLSHNEMQIQVKWDSGRSLSVLLPPDKIEIIGD